MIFLFLQCVSTVIIVYIIISPLNSYLYIHWILDLNIIIIGLKTFLLIINTQMSHIFNIVPIGTIKILSNVLCKAINSYTTKEEYTLAHSSVGACREQTCVFPLQQIHILRMNP